MFEFLRTGKNPDELCDGNSYNFTSNLQNCKISVLGNCQLFFNDFFDSGEILAYLYTMQYMS